MSFRPVINDIAVLRPDSMALFPNLTELFWSYAHGDLWRESVFFMHKGIKKFSLMLWLGETGGQETILQYFEHIAMRMPHLQSFNLNLCPYDATAESQAHIGPALSWLLPKLRFLTALTLPPMVDAYSVISSTASLPNLETINANIDVTIDRSLFSVSAPSPPHFQCHVIPQPPKPQPWYFLCRGYYSSSLYGVPCVDQAVFMVAQARVPDIYPDTSRGL